MNGRVYDPNLGRFISADPHIQSPLNSQSLNRYSYVMNNPLSFTDPSGFFFKKLFKSIFGLFKSLFKGVVSFIKSILNQPILRTIVAVVIMVIPGGQGVGAIMLKGFAAGYVGSGGDLKAGLVGAITAGAFNWVGHGANSPWKNLSDASSNFLRASKVAAHGVVGGLSSKLNSGKFAHGFLSAGTTQAFAGKIGGLDSGNTGISAQRTIAAAAIGGASSALGGGKFANGALTGAFSRVFNDDAKYRVNAKRLAQVRINRLLNGAQDGHITLSEANAHRAFGGGRTLAADLSKIDLSELSLADFPNGVGARHSIQLLGRSADGLVYGHIDLLLTSPTTVISGGSDTYYFDYTKASIKSNVGNYLGEKYMMNRSLYL